VNFLNFTFSALLGPVVAGILFRAGKGSAGMDLWAARRLTPASAEL
jgi:hypothetical protein